MSSTVPEKFSSKEELGTPVGKKLGKLVNFSFKNGMEEKKLKNLNEKYKRPENCPHLSLSKVNSEVWDGNLQIANCMADVSLRKIQLVNVSAGYAFTKMGK